MTARPKSQKITSVFEYTCFRDFLAACLSHHPKRQKPLSLNLWTKRLGLRSPRTIAMILKGSRHPSAKLVEAFAQDLSLTGPAKRYFELLIHKDRLTKQNADVSAVDLELRELGQDRKYPQLMSERLERFAADWYGLVIHLMVGAPGFVEDAELISRRLFHKITPMQVRIAIHDLLALGMLRREHATGKLLQTSDQPFFSSTDIPSHAIRSHHKQMLQRATEALSEQSVDTREFMSSNIAVRRSSLPAIKSFMRETRDKFYKLFEDSTAEDVIQWNQQLFFHTERVNR